MDEKQKIENKLLERADSKCELCKAAGEKLHLYDVQASEKDPVIEKCLMLCDGCIKKLDNLDNLSEDELKFVTEAVWSNVPIVKALAVHILRRIKDKYYWAQNLEEELYLDEETLDLLDMIDFSDK